MSRKSRRETRRWGERSSLQSRLPSRRVLYFRDVTHPRDGLFRLYTPKSIYQPRDPRRATFYSKVIRSSKQFPVLQSITDYSPFEIRRAFQVQGHDHCRKRSARRGVMFAINKAGPGKRLSPGRGGTYNRTPDSTLPC